jgi:hypothetical protein
MISSSQESTTKACTEEAQSPAKEAQPPSLQVKPARQQKLQLSSLSMQRAAKEAQPPGQEVSPPFKFLKSQSKREILSFYGIQTAQLPILDCTLVPSSEENISSSEDSDAAPAASLEPSTSVFWFDSADLCLKRLSADGHEEQARMEPGPNGFCIAFFQDTPAVGITTEMPNLMLEVKQTVSTVIKRPSSQGSVVMKKPSTKRKSQDLKQLDAETSVSQELALDVQSPVAAPTKPQNYVFTAEKWGTCKAEFYSKKSYCRFQEEGKWKLIVGSEKKEHQHIVQSLVPFIKLGHDKGFLKQKREEFEAEDVN